jgi:hypothetical protein
MQHGSSDQSLTTFSKVIIVLSFLKFITVTVFGALIGSLIWIVYVVALAVIAVPILTAIVLAVLALILSAIYAPIHIFLSLAFDSIKGIKKRLS